MNKIEKIIEELAMGLTHSEQGVYKKNEKIVRDLIVKFQKESIKFERKRIEKIIKRKHKKVFLKSERKLKDFDERNIARIVLGELELEILEGIK